MRTYFIIIGVCLSMQGFAQSSLSSKEFVAINAQDIHLYSDTSKTFVSVLKKENKIEFIKNKSVVISEYAVESGTLLNINRGEFGRFLFYKPNDPLKSSINVNGQISPVNSSKRFYFNISNDKFINKNFSDSVSKNFAFLTNGYVLVVADNGKSAIICNRFDELSGTPNYIYRITINKDGFLISDIATLNIKPIDALIYNEKVYFQTENALSLYCINDGKADLVIPIGKKSDSLQPTSVATIDGEIFFIGIRGGFVKINIHSGDPQFFVYAANK